MAKEYRGSRRRRARRQAEERRNSLSTATRVGRYNLECKRQWQSLKAKVAGAFLAMSLYTSPLQDAQAAGTTNIKRDGGAAINPTATGGNVYDVFAEKVKDETLAINRFSNFELANNDIANMYFHEKGGATEAAALVNFVENKVDISGTVNAIRNNAIGGRLYFVTPRKYSCQQHRCC